ncbi:hypothetical protein GCM10010156_49600 [Planobispora rosea]|uniref:Methyltransferase n=1 Tax=Planobispora rosea TaxID=35762 RepID=A0A8J3S0U5_PLARO|nr:methyltransferase [Planobispora rosea]GGS85074.1 hypothetical protein GCM10010156_49600 [Planobispora rosea]GIH86471.1 hypothetical protein Pro02_48790 [Planobispora rosea]
MLKLTKAQATLHRQADDLVRSSEPLSEEEVEFVLAHWQEASTITNPLDGAFFTPRELARDLALHIGGCRVIDLCAGIGHLAWGYRQRYVTDWERDKAPLQLVCVEKNPAYVEVGRRLLPEARWICADVFDLPQLDLGRFDAALANPPFGFVTRGGLRSPRYRGNRIEYHVIDLAADLADRGAFILPQTLAPFCYSGPRPSQWDYPQVYRHFTAQTGIKLRFNVGIDTACYPGWRGVAPLTEIVTVDFRERSDPVARPGRRTTSRRTTRAQRPVSDALF